MTIKPSPSLGKLLQLASPNLPVGAYSYSEGLETLVQAGHITNADQLQHWLRQELSYGSFNVEGAVLMRAYQAVQQENPQQLIHWNRWWSALRDTEELRLQSWQMGRSLQRLALQVIPETQPWFEAVGNPCNFVIAFGTIAAHWQLPLGDVVYSYGYAWLSNLITAGVKLIPLGQTAGQRLLLTLDPILLDSTHRALTWEDDELGAWSGGSAWASSTHETLYTRLFQS